MDSMTIQGVKEEPEVYTLKEDPEEEGTDGAANWFDMAAAEAGNLTMEFPEGYYNIRDTIKDIMQNPEAAGLLTSAMNSMTGMKLKKGMLMMIGGKTIEELMAMSKDMGMAKEIPGDVMAVLNRQLNKIKKS